MSWTGEEKIFAILNIWRQNHSKLKAKLSRMFNLTIILSKAEYIVGYTNFKEHGQ